MELSRILIRELAEIQMIELREVAPGSLNSEVGAPPGVQNTEIDEASLRTFPIVIGLTEAQAIQRRLKGEVIKRPQTHDLLANVIESLGARLDSIAVNDLNEHTFFAVLQIIAADGRRINVDCRPSDAIALGVAGNVPIYVAEHVLDAASKDEE